MAAPASASANANANGPDVYRWEWENADVGMWQPYDDATSAIIELAYTQRVPTAQLTHGFFGDQGGYTIDLNRFVQTRNTTGFRRRIRRHPPVPPLAGAPAPTGLAFGSGARAIKKGRQPEKIYCDPSKLAELQEALQLIRNPRYDEGYVREDTLFLDVDDDGKLLRQWTEQGGVLLQ